jgi:hypothetical protein
VRELREEDRLRIDAAVDPARLNAPERSFRDAGRRRRSDRFPACTAPLALLVLSREFDEVVDDLATEVGLDRFGVELHAPHRSMQVLDGHDQPIGRARGHAERIGQRLLRHQRVIAHHVEGRGNLREQRAAIVFHRTDAPVHRAGRMHDLAAMDVHQSLVTEADAEHRHRGMAQHVVADAHVRIALGRARPRRDHDRVVILGLDGGPCDLVVPDDGGRNPGGVAQVVGDVRSEAVVIVDK